MQQTVLIIDDQCSLQEFYRTVLQAAGYQVLVAGDALTGLSLARTARPDAIVMDARMPDAGSQFVLQRLRREPATASIPVILITCQPRHDRALAQLSASIAAKLSKPFQPADLLHAIECGINRADYRIAV